MYYAWLFFSIAYIFSMSTITLTTKLGIYWFRAIVLVVFSNSNNKMNISYVMKIWASWCMLCSLSIVLYDWKFCWMMMLLPVGYEQSVIPSHLFFPFIISIHIPTSFPPQAIPEHWVTGGRSVRGRHVAGWYFFSKLPSIYFNIFIYLNTLLIW